MSLVNILGGLALDSTVQLPDLSRVTQIGTTMTKWSDGFSGPNLAAGAATLAAIAENWNVVRNVGSVTIQETGSALLINTGTASGNEMLLVGRHICTIPQNLTITWSLSARNANQEVRMGYLEVDAAGNMVANPNLTNFPNNFCAMLLNGTSTTNTILETLSGGNPTSTQVNFGGQNGSNGNIESAIEVRPEDVVYSHNPANSGGARSANVGRINSMVPSHAKRYAPFIWVRNTAATTNAQLTVQRILSMDVQELQVEVGGGRGNSSGAASVPVNVVGGNTNVNVTDARVTTGSNGSQYHKVNTVASTTNLNNIKSSIGRIVGGIVHNTHTAPLYMKFFNATSTGGVTLGTTVPLFQLPIPAGGFVNFADIFDQYGFAFSTGITYAVTTLPADLDNTALPATASLLVGTILFA